MKIMRLFCLVLGISIICTGCNKNIDDPDQKEEYSFPEKYEKTSDSGKVRFDCTLEIPDDIKGQSIDAVDVEGRYCCDREKAWSLFGEGKEVIEKYEIPVDQGKVASDYYEFADDEGLGIDEGISYGSINSKYYLYIGATNSDKQEMFEESEISFKSGEECIGEIKSFIDELGYHSEEFVFNSYPLNFQVMKDMEDQCIQDGSLTEEKRKESWSQEDDAYFIYAYQKNGDTPVFHELMSIARIMAYDTPDNAPIQIIYSARGIELLNINNVYQLHSEGDKILLKPFEDIAAVVEEKFENVLNDAKYEVTRAKLYERVYLDKKQKYRADPIWYFEVMENNVSKSVTLINGETGKEIFLQ